jgi:alcohol dehydrogenase class IV
MVSFEFATANRIIFGAGKLNELGKQIEDAALSAEGLSKGRTKRLLLVCGHSSDAITRVEEILSAPGILFTEFQVHGEPTIEVVREGVKAARGCEAVIGKGQPLVNAPLPYIAIPTTAGTGSEVTRNAVLESTEQNVKVSLRSPMMLSRLALIDPELTYTLPPEITASSGLDALTQLIEPFVSVKANPMTDAICREGLSHARRSLRGAYENDVDKEAREGMSLASLFGGLALANAALGAAHGFAGPLGGMLHAPHGALCARFLPLVMEVNIRALETRQPQHPALKRYAEIAQILTGEKDATAQDGVKWVSDLVSALKIPRLVTYGMSEEKFSEAIEKTRNANSFKGNPIALNDEELRKILVRAL